MILDFRGSLPKKAAADAVNLSGTIVTAGGALSNIATVATNLPRPNSAMIFELDVTAAATAVGDTLDVVVQTSEDGTNFVDVVHFTQVVGNGGAKRYFAKVPCNAAQAMYEVGTALTAGNIRNVIGDSWRVQYTQAQTTAATFTFAVWAMPV